MPAPTPGPCDRIMYEIFEHTADLGLRVRAGDLAELFEEAARALFSVIVADLQTVRPVQQIAVQIEAAKPDDLLFDWLAELLYTFDARGLLLAGFDVSVDEAGLRATVSGEPIDRARHQLQTEVKAITYHQLKVEREDEGWLAEVIVDV